MKVEEILLNRMKENYSVAAGDFTKINLCISESDLSYKNRCVQTLAVPKIYTHDDWYYFKDFVKGCFNIFNKVIEHYIDDSAYRKLFGFSEELEKLILLPKQFGVNVPMARVDFFYNEDSREIKLCEINTDGTSAMNEDRILVGFLPQNRIVSEYIKPGYKTFELFDTWVTEFLSTYSEYSVNEIPHVAIVDFLDKATINEFSQFQKAFENRGISTEICDIRKLKLENNILSSEKNIKIDAIYRRAVTSDIMKNIESVQPFLSAVQNNLVCLIGGFRTQLIHNKLIFYVLHLPESKKIFSDDENSFIERHVPYTAILTDHASEKLHAIESKNRWIIKPFDLYGSKGVYAGCDFSDDEWKKHILDSIESGDYLIQEYCKPYRSLNIDFTDKKPDVRSFSNLTGVFCYNEKPYGIYSRLSNGNVISSQYDEKTVPTILYD